PTARRPCNHRRIQVDAGDRPPSSDARWVCEVADLRSPAGRDPDGKTNLREDFVGYRPLDQRKEFPLLTPDVRLEKPTDSGDGFAVHRLAAQPIPNGRGSEAPCSTNARSTSSD